MRDLVLELEAAQKYQSPQSSASVLTSSTPAATQVTETLEPTPDQEKESVAAAPVKASKPKSLVSPVFYLLKLALLGVGLAAIVGTGLAILHPEQSDPQLVAKTKSAKAQPETQSTAATSEVVSSVALPTGPQLTEVEAQIKNLIAANTGLTSGLFFLNLDSGAYVNLAGEASFPAASTIKIPILVAFFQDVDAGKIRLDEQLVMRPDLIASEAGEMQYQPPGTKFSALETASKMIIISDNTATNMLIDRLGGSALLNQRFKSWGLSQTVINNLLPDLEGTNTTTPKDLATLMMQVGQGQLVTARSRDRLLDIMRQTVTNTLLPQGLGEGATIAHKTGDIGTVIGDVGLIDMPDGQRYVAAVMVKRPFNDVRARELIQKISRLAYQTFSQPQPQPAATTQPAAAVVSPSSSSSPQPATATTVEPAAPVNSPSASPSP